jgi:membrane-associated phospholipid phosphatase
VNTGGSVSGISRPLLIATLLSLASFLTLVLVAATLPISDLDQRTRMLVHLTRLPILDAAMNGVSGLGENYGLIPLIALGVALLWRSSRRWAVAYLLARSAVTRPVRRLGYAGCAATVLAVAFSRLYLDAHWVSDVAGGFTLGLAYLLPAIVLVERVSGDRRRGSESQVELADDERGGPDVDPVAEPI